MLQRSFSLLCALFFFSSLLFFENSYGIGSTRKPLLLNYLPNVPINHYSSLEVTFYVFLPHQSFNFYSRQVLDTEMMVIGKNAQSSVQLPFDIQLIPKALKMNMKINDKEISHYKIEDLDKVVGDPFIYSVDDRYAVTPDRRDLRLFLQELPLLNNFAFKGLFSSVFEQLFALGGKDLVPETVHHQQLSQINDRFSPIPVVYKIVEVDEDVIRAKVQGSSRIQIFPMSDFIDVYPDKCSSCGKEAKIVVSSSVEGEVQWDRENALIHQSKFTYSYFGDIISGNQSAPFELYIVLDMDAYEKEQL